MEKNNATNEQLLATDRVYALRENSTDNDLAKLLGISKVTLYTRLRRNNWKVSELALIENLTS